MNIENKPAPASGRGSKATMGPLGSCLAFLAGPAVADPDKSTRAGINSFGAKAGNLAAANAIGVTDIVVHSHDSWLFLAGSHNRDSFFATEPDKILALNSREVNQNVKNFRRCFGKLERSRQRGTVS